MGTLIKDIIKNSYTRLLLVVFLGLVVLAIYFISMMYYIQIEDSKVSEIARLQGIAKSTCSLIKAKDLSYLIKKYPHQNDIKSCQQDDVYYYYHSILKEIQEKNNLSTAIYILCFDQKEKNFFFTFTSNVEPYYRHKYTSFPQTLIKNYHQGGTLQPYEDQHGTWMSAFEPIKNEKGETIGVIQVDEKFDKFIKNARMNGGKQLLLSSIIFIVIGLILYRKVESFLKEEEERQISMKYKTHQITSSIHYAKKIQEAILPSTELIQSNLPKSFVYYKPKDIVSGDFYWFSDKHIPHLFMAIVDCTGHGVPGAFMSMIGNTILNKLINEKQMTDVGAILDAMEIELRKALNREDHFQATSDGMDLALINICSTTNQLFFAGAQRPLIHIHNKTLTEYKGTRRSIGQDYEKNIHYNIETIPLKKGDCIYMFSDGYQDQFGGKEGKKFMKRHLKKILLEIHLLPMKQQKELLHKELIKWKGEEEQVDDILLIGIQY